MSTKSKSTKSAANADAYESAVNAGKENVEQAMKASTEAASKGYEQALAASQKNIDAATRNYDDLAVVGKDTVEAFVAAGNVAAKGVEAFNAEMLAFAKLQVEDSVEASRALFGAKTLQEAIELQAGFAKSYFDAYVSETSKLGELAAKTAQDALEPINARYAEAMEKWIKTAA